MQQQGQQIRQPQMMMQQQLRGPGPNPQGQQNVMGGGQQMMPNTLQQIAQPGQVIGQGQTNILDDFNFGDLM